VAVRGRRIPAAPVRSLLRLAEPPHLVWSTAETTVAAGNAAVRLAADGPDRFASVRDAAETVLAGIDAPPSLPSAARPRLFGGFAFDGDHDATTDTPWKGFPSALFLLPAVQITTTGDTTWLTAAAVGDGAPGRAAERLDAWADRLASAPDFDRAPAPGVRSRTATPDREGWRGQLRTALDRIASGELRKVVLAQSLGVDLATEPVVPDILAGLADRYPECTRFLMRPEGAGAFFGATPERLVSVEDRDVHATVLAGSTGRGETDAEDAWLAQDLRESAKDRHEHDVVLDAIRDRLAPLSTTVEARDRRVRKLATIQHLETPVEATLAEDHHVLDLVERLHPTPAVGGMPQGRALETIRELEPFDRGWYAAPFGWIDAAGNGTFVVALRSAVADDSRATLFAGSGIVDDSDPDFEWDEVQVKFRPILDELE
jgi:menaquinone-specific isochorismate synthase